MALGSYDGGYRKLAIRQYPSLPGRQTAESRYWRRFRVRALSRLVLFMCLKTNLYSIPCWSRSLRASRACTSRPSSRTTLP